MEPYEYATMASLETDFWWYRGLHGALVDLLTHAGLVPGAHLLDAGCGTGGALAYLAKALPGVRTSGFDFSPHAAPFWVQRDLTRCALASINAIPFRDASFDTVMSVDVLESDAVDLDAAVRELCRITRPGGIMLLVVPAYRWLRTDGHHRAVQAWRRFTRREVIALFDGHAVTITRSTHYFALLFPVIAAVRLALRLSTTLFPPDPTVPARSELSALPPPLNAILSAIMAFERRLLRHVDLPFGTSIIVVARKQEPSEAAP